MVRKIKFEVFCIICSLLISGSGIVMAFRPSDNLQEEMAAAVSQYDYLPLNEDVPDILFESSQSSDKSESSQKSTSIANSSSNSHSSSESSVSHSSKVTGTSPVKNKASEYLDAEHNVPPSEETDGNNIDTEIPNDFVQSEPIIQFSSAVLEKSSVFYPSSVPKQSTALPSSEKNASPNSPAPNNNAGNLLVTVGGYTQSLPAADVVAKFVEMEIGSSFHVEAIKAQAVASHTYIAYYNSIGKAPVLPDRNPGSKVKNAVEEVINKKIYYNGNLINAVYCASTAGKTNASSDVWGGHLPYLVSVESEFDYLDPNWNYTTKISIDDVKTFVQNNTGIELSGNPGDWLKILSYNAAGYVADMSIGGSLSYSSAGQQVKITGRNLREQILTNGGMILKSANFSIDISGNDFVFTTKGYGHGVGMSQHGANLYATHKGYTYEQILKHYYTGVDIL